MSDEIAKAAERLRAKYGLTIMAYAADYTWCNLVAESGGWGCVLRNKNGNITMQFCATVIWGQFEYNELHISHIGVASDLAVKRIKSIAKRLEVIE
jgi:hypothetical protein